MERTDEATNHDESEEGPLIDLLPFRLCGSGSIFLALLRLQLLLALLWLLRLGLGRSMGRLNLDVWSSSSRSRFGSSIQDGLGFLIGLGLRRLSGRRGLLNSFGALLGCLRCERCRRSGHDLALSTQLVGSSRGQRGMTVDASSAIGSSGFGLLLVGARLGGFGDSLVGLRLGGLGFDASFVSGSLLLVLLDRRSFDDRRFYLLRRLLHDLFLIGFDFFDLKGLKCGTRGETAPVDRRRHLGRFCLSQRLCVGGRDG